MRGSASEYSVQCGCGRTTAVTKADAGGAVACGCGQQVRVPRLSELRRQAGQAAFETGVVDRIRQMIVDGRLPPEQICQISLRPTQDVLQVTVECETPRSNYSWWMLLFFSLISRAAYNAAAQEEAVGRETVLRLPLRIDTECQPQVRRYSAARLRELLRAVPIYGELLTEYPKAKISVR